MTKMSVQECVDKVCSSLQCEEDNMFGGMKVKKVLVGHLAGHASFYTAATKTVAVQHKGKEIEMLCLFYPAIYSHNGETKITEGFSIGADETYLVEWHEATLLRFNVHNVEIYSDEESEKDIKNYKAMLQERLYREWVDANDSSRDAGMFIIDLSWIDDM